MAWKGNGSPGFIRRDPAERSGDPAGTVLSYRMEKPDVYGIFLFGSPFLCGGSCEAADARENEVSGPAFFERKVKGVYGDGGFRESARGACDGKAGEHYRGGGRERVLRREGGSPYDPIPGCRDEKWNVAWSYLRQDGDHVRGEREYQDRASDRGDFERTVVFQERFYDDPVGVFGVGGKCVHGIRGLP